MTLRTIAIAAVALVLCLGSSAQTAGKDARRKNTAMVPARIHFSGNIVGELEPCG